MGKIGNREKQLGIVLIYGFFSFIALRKLLLQQGTVGHNWDWSIPILPSYLRRASYIAPFLWDDLHLGNPITIFWPASFIHGIIGLPGYLNFSGDFISKLLVMVTIFISSLSMFLLAKNILNSISISKNGDDATFSSFIAGLFYGFSPFLYSMFIGGSIGQFIPYSLMPLFLLFSFKYLRSNNMVYLIGGSLNLSIICISIQQMIIVLLVLFFYILILEKKRENLFKFFLIVTTFFFVTFPWFMATITSMKDIGTFYMSPEFTHLENIKGGFPTLIRSFIIAGFGDRHFFFRSVSPGIFSVWIFISYLFVGSVYSSLLLQSGKRKILFWITILVIGLAFSTGGNIPFWGSIIFWLYKNIPFMNIFRSSQNLLPILNLGFAVILAIGIYQLNYKYFPNRSFVFRAVIVFVILFYLHPFFTHGDLGLVYLQKNYPSGNHIDLFTLPDEYKKAIFFLEEKSKKDQFRVLIFPMSTSPEYLKTPYQSKGQGGDPLLAHSPFSITVADFAPHGIVMSKMMVVEIERCICDIANGVIDADESYILQILKLLNIKYVVLRKDVIPGYGSCWRRYDKKKFSDLILHMKFLKVIYDSRYVTLFSNTGKNNSKIY